VFGRHLVSLLLGVRRFVVGDAECIGHFLDLVDAKKLPLFFGPDEKPRSVVLVVTARFPLVSFGIVDSSGLGPLPASSGKVTARRREIDVVLV
jgi:hypothetical protein